MNAFFGVFGVAEFESDIHCVKQAYMDICQYSLRIVPRIVFFKAVKIKIMRLVVNVVLFYLTHPPKKVK